MFTGARPFCTQIGVHCQSLKRRDLEKTLTEFGWRFLRSGGRHDVWTDGEREEAVPRHREINEQLARAILRRIQKESK
jgi:mRNA interferase HicA